MSKADRLTPKEEAFCLAYLETGSASEAYRRAYSAKKMKPATIHVKASQLLDRDKVTVRLEEVRESRLKRHEVTVDRIVAELEKIAFANADDFFAWGPTGVVIKASDELTPEQRIFSARSPPYKPRLARGLVSFIFSQRQYAIVCGATIRMRLAPHVTLFIWPSPVVVSIV